MGLSMTQSEDGRIPVLLISEDQAEIAELEKLFADLPFTLRHAGSPDLAVQYLREDSHEDNIEVVLLDLALEPSSPTYSVLSRVGARRLPMVAITAPGDSEPELSAVAEGAHEHVRRDEMTSPLLLRCLRFAMDRHRLEMEIERLAHGDALTGVRNRRYLFKALDAAFAAARRHGHPLSVSVCDVDRFKQVNDTYGHFAGDRVLTTVAEVLRENMRAEDVVARFGGDEFCLLLPHVDVEGAEHALQRIAGEVRNRPVQFEGEEIAVSMTFGVAELSGEHRTSRELFDAADRALYRGKQRGDAGTVNR